MDEVGYLPVDSREAYLFFQFISYRYEKTSTIITSNKTLTDWSVITRDVSLAGAIIDRLMHHGQVFYLKGPSWRVKVLRAGLSAG